MQSNVRRVLTLGLVSALSCASCADSDAATGGSDAAAQAATTPAAGQIPDIRLEAMWPGMPLVRPVQVTHDGVHADRLYVVEQPGRILAVDRDASASTFDVILDLREPVFDRHNEEGLLALAFHPDFATNRWFFIYYSADKPRRGVVARYTMRDDDGVMRADPDSGLIILEQEQRWGNHNGCALAFGPDGMLYISLGDGGAANDPLGSGQDLSTLLGTILRIDVDRASAEEPYAVPADNPFVGRADARDEIWAYGLRNVWRMSFDRETGELWAGDVGQNRWEEIDLIVKGGNYGWNRREGKHPFRGGDDAEGMIDPVVEYPRQLGVSVTGGHVYRGAAHASLQGVYLYADYATGRIWGFRYEDGEARGNREVLQGMRRPISSFGEDVAGEMYVTTFNQADKRGTKGRVYRIGVRE